MPSQLPYDDGANTGDDYIQYRGPGGNVVAEPVGTDARLPFDTVVMMGASYQKPYPVVDDDAEDPPGDAVFRSIAEVLVDTNPLICWGAACPADGCDDVFEGPDGVQSHYRQMHSDETTDSDGDDGGDADA